MNNVWNEIENMCRERDYISYTYSTQLLSDLNADTYYRVEIKAHNAIGYSVPTNVYVKTTRGESSNSFGTLTYQAGYGVHSSATNKIPCLVVGFSFICSLVLNTYITRHN